MTEKDLIKKIQKLKEIEPRKDWVLLTKGRILEEETPQPFKVSLGDFFRVFQLKPALALLLALLLASSGVFYFLNQTSVSKLSQLNQIESEKLAQLQLLTPSLEKLQANISQVKENLEKASVQDPQTVLTIGKNIGSTAKAGKEVLSKAKKIVEIEATTSEELTRGPAKERVLTSITDTEKALGDLEKSYRQKVQETVEFLIADIEHWALGEIDQSAFEGAKELYRAGEYEQALEKILLLGNQ